MVIPISFIEVFGIGALSELAFAIITLLIGLFGLKIYKLCKQNNYKVLSLAFFFISAAYLFKSLVNVFVFFEIITPLDISAQSVLALLGYGVIVHIVLMLLALLILVNLVLKIRNRYVFLLLLILSFFPLIITWMNYPVFYALASLLLLYLVVYFYYNYRKVKSKNAFYVFLGFLFILVGQVLYIFISYTTYFFVFGHVFEFLGYLFLLINYIRIVKHGKEKR